MALASVCGVVLDGVDGMIVRVEVSVSDGLPSMGVVGLPDASVAESRWRARCAVEACGRRWPDRRITVSLSPAEVRKTGAGLDLPIAVGILAADRGDPWPALERTALIGELGLDGRLRSTHGLLAMVLAVRAAGVASVVVPAEAPADIDAVPGISVLRARTLAQACAVLEGTDDGATVEAAHMDGRPASTAPSADLADVRGHALPRWALEVAAAGGHHLALVGSPGVGKTLLAERLPGLLPPLDDERALQVAAIHSVAGAPRSRDEVTAPPWAAPHHSASSAALLGSVRGGRAVPGAVSLAHNGVLFLDEAPEFARPALEGLRQPLECGTLVLGRTGWSGRMPARFQLVIAANPCPCGLRTGTGASCSCAPAAIRRYAARLSGPLLDRIDIRLAVERPSQAELDAATPAEPSDAVRARVQEARLRMTARYRDLPWAVNAEVPAGELRRRWPLRSAAADVLHEVERGSANLRGVDRILRMAWTLGDLRGVDRPDRDDVAGALALRGAHLGWT